MKRTFVTTICVLMLLSFLAASLSPQLAQGMHVNAVWETYYLQPSGEQQAEDAVCNYINSTFNSLSANWDSIWFSANQTTATNAYACLSNVDNSNADDFLAWFSTGNGFQYQPTGNTWHFYYYGDNSGMVSTAIQDAKIYSVADGSKDKFTFIWTCMNGDEWTQDGKTVYGYWDSQNNTGPVGMPYAFTQTTGLSLNGYGSGADKSGICYIGFNGCAKNLSDRYENVIGETYANFVDYFYYYFVDCGTSVTTALNLASNALNTTQPLFSMNPLYQGYMEYQQMNGVWTYFPGVMVVIGDGNLVLPNVG